MSNFVSCIPKSPNFEEIEFSDVPFVDALLEHTTPLYKAYDIITSTPQDTSEWEPGAMFSLGKSMDVFGTVSRTGIEKI